MERGDISNQFSPTLAIDVDDLIIFTQEKWWGLWEDIKVNPAAIPVCEYHFRKGRMIYLVYHTQSKEDALDLESFLDSVDFPYTKLFAVLDDKDRELILSRDHVHFYFFKNPLHAATKNKRKEKHVGGIEEVYF